jgi:hypothetical protein
MTVNQPPPEVPSPWIGAGPPRQHRGSAWSVLGWSLAVALGVLGLVAIAFGVIVIVGLNSWGNNK